MYDVELSEYIQRKMNRIQAEKEDTVLTESDIQKIYQSLIGANITDPKIRAEHVDKAGVLGREITVQDVKPLLNFVTNLSHG